MGAEGEGAVPIKTSVTFLFGGSRDWLAACAILAKEELPPLRCLREGFVMFCSKMEECCKKKFFSVFEGQNCRRSNTDSAVGSFRRCGRHGKKAKIGC